MSKICEIILSAVVFTTKQNLGRQDDFANFWHFLTWIQSFFKPIAFLGLNKVHSVEKRLNSCEKMSSKIISSADVFTINQNLGKHSTVLSTGLNLLRCARIEPFKITLRQICNPVCLFAPWHFCIHFMSSSRKVKAPKLTWATTERREKKVLKTLRDFEPKGAKPALPFESCQLLASVSKSKTKAVDLPELCYSM